MESAFSINEVFERVDRGYIESVLASCFGKNSIEYSQLEDSELLDIMYVNLTNQGVIKIWQNYVLRIDAEITAKEITSSLRDI